MALEGEMVDGETHAGRGRAPVEGEIEFEIEIQIQGQGGVAVDSEARGLNLGPEIDAQLALETDIGGKDQVDPHDITAAVLDRSPGEVAAAAGEHGNPLFLQITQKAAQARLAAGVVIIRGALAAGRAPQGDGRIADKTGDVAVGLEVMLDVAAEIQQFVKAQQLDQIGVDAGDGLVENRVAGLDQLAGGGVVGVDQVAAQGVDDAGQLVHHRVGGVGEDAADVAHVGVETGVETAIVEITVAKGDGAQGDAGPADRSVERQGDGHPVVQGGAVAAGAGVEGKAGGAGVAQAAAHGKVELAMGQMIGGGVPAGVQGQGLIGDTEIDIGGIHRAGERKFVKIETRLAGGGVDSEAET